MSLKSNPQISAKLGIVSLLLILFYSHSIGGSTDCKLSF